MSTETKASIVPTSSTTTTSDASKRPANTPNSVKFLIGGSAGYINQISNSIALFVFVFYRVGLMFRMAATLFVQPMDMVKNRMQMSGEGGGIREHKTSFHALAKIFRNEGFRGIYTG